MIYLEGGERERERGEERRGDHVIIQMPVLKNQDIECEKVEPY